jgi:putative acetyltransferase
MNDLRIEVRNKLPGDEAQICEVTKSAFETSEFGHNGEAGLIDQLRSEGAAAISLVAEYENQIVGHILFSPATIEWTSRSSTGLGLAPVSVVPEFQRQRIGSRLIEAGLEAAANGTSEFVIVLGHPDYYPKFGFTPASASNVRCEFEGVPDEAFMIRWAEQSGPCDDSGIAKYHSAFSTLG